MRTPSSRSRPVEVPNLKPEVLELAVGTPANAAVGRPESAASADLQMRLKFVQVGLWEARRRWLAGQTQGLDTILAHLDEDLELLGLALSDEPSPPRTSRSRRPEAAPLT